VGQSIAGVDGGVPDGSVADLGTPPPPIDHTWSAQLFGTNYPNQVTIQIRASK
jgi:hypothetical protein